MRSYREFFGGYCRSEEVRAVIEARESGLLAKNELRLFFATLEHEQTGSRLPIDVVLNKHRKQKKRMTAGQQGRAKRRLRKAIASHKQEGEYGVKLPRKFLRAAASGFLDVSSMIVGLFYFTKRMPQRSRRQSLVRGERYGRLSIRSIEKATGLCKDMIVKALRNLRSIKLIALVWRPMQEIKRFGSLFVDGLKVSLSFQKPEQSRSCAPSARHPNTRTVPPKKPNEKKETLTNNSYLEVSRKGRDAIERFNARFCPHHVVI